MADALAGALLVPLFSVLVPLFVGTVLVLHLLREREGQHDVARSVLLAAASWAAIWIVVRTVF